MFRVASRMYWRFSRSFFFFFNDTATTEIYTLSLHDALPISSGEALTPSHVRKFNDIWGSKTGTRLTNLDRKSTRLNSSHSQISYAVFCLKKKRRRITNARHGDAAHAREIRRTGAVHPHPRGL